MEKEEKKAEGCAEGSPLEERSDSDREKKINVQCTIYGGKELVELTR